MPREDDTLTRLRSWLKENWEPDLTVQQWWERLAPSGWAVPTWPTDWFGQALSRDEGRRVQAAIGEFGALGAPGAFATLMAGPTIYTHGSQEQKQRYLPDIVTGRKAWCQLFSEPAAGSDLAGLQTTAVRDGDEWIVSGQKVWTTQGHLADMGMLLVRTNPDAPKHKGLSFFAFDMHQDGVEVRPLREMTGRSLFNEVFLTDARVPDHALIGGADNGWTVANTTLAFERASLGAGGNAAALTATAGTVAGDLARRVGDLVGEERPSAPPVVMAAQAFDVLVTLARRNGTISDPLIRQDLVRLHTYNELAVFTSLRQRGLAETGKQIPFVGNLAKLSMSRINRLVRDVGLDILGPAGTLHDYDGDDGSPSDEPSGDEMLHQAVTEMALRAQGPPIYGGSDEIQHNILGERALGLPREPGPDPSTPFRDLPRNG